MTEDGTHYPAPTTCEEVQCCSHDHPEEDVSGEAESHCGDRCCADDKDSDCESSVGNCEDSCCEPHEDHEVREESVHRTEPQGTLHIPPFGA
jgi:hypothetical protein